MALIKKFRIKKFKDNEALLKLENISLVENNVEKILIANASSFHKQARASNITNNYSSVTLTRKNGPEKEP